MKINSGGEVVGTLPAGRRRHDVVVCREGVANRTVFQLEANGVGAPIINDVGQVIVSWTSGSQVRLFGRLLFPRSRRCCLWDPQRGRISLDRYLAPGRGEDFWLTDLNNQGCIVGQVWSTKNPSRSRGILLEPIAERWGK